MVRLLILVALLGMASAAKLPSSFKKCKRSDPDMNGCLVKAIGDAIPVLVKGVPSLGIFPIDPLDISELSIGQGEGPVKINLDFKNIKFMGVKSAQVDEIDFDHKNYKLTAKVTIKDSIRVEGPYKVDGQVLVLPIQGEGACNLTLIGVKAVVVLQGEAVTKNGEKFMEVKDFDVTIMNTDHLYVHFDNLFNGDETLGNNMNKFLNENWQEILNELKPPVQKALGLTFQQISNRLFLKVPFDEVFPED